jgi:hypothetical protein
MMQYTHQRKLKGARILCERPMNPSLSTDPKVAERRAWLQPCLRASKPGKQLSTKGTGLPVP